MPSKRIVCKHCKKTRYPKQRGLCWKCANNLKVLRRYPITSKFARRGVRNFYGSTKLPSKPTDAFAGSEAKLKVLMKRAALGVSLWHPEDSKLLDCAALALKHGSPRAERHKRKTYAL